MTSAARPSPFRWWHLDGWRPPEPSEVLYNGSEWVQLFLRCLDDELAKVRARPAAVHLDTGREALVATGLAGPQTLRTVRARYRDVLLFHPAPHPAVDRWLDTAVVAAAKACAAQGSHQANELVDGGRAGLRAKPSLLLDAEVVAGLRKLKAPGLPPIGVSGLIELQTDDGAFLLASLRSDQVAVNPRCLGPAIDGGLNWATASGDPAVGLWHEIKDELPGLVEAGQLHLSGTVVPPVAPTAIAGVPCGRSGINAVYEASIAMAPAALFRRVRDHFEAKELVLVALDERPPGSAGPKILRQRGGDLVELADVPPMSEILAAELARRGLVEVSTGRARPARSSPQSNPTEARPMSTKTPVTAELTLEDAWAEDLIERHSRLNRMLGKEALADIAEKGGPTSLDDLLPVFDAVREYEFVRTGRLKAADEARLFEALVYRIGRYLFDNRDDWALAGHDLLLPRSKAELRDEGLDANPIGTFYTDRLKAVGKEDLDEDPGGVWLDEVTEALAQLNRDEAVQEYAEVARRGRLLCFCAALWALENKRGASAASLALDDKYRKSLSGDVVALFFRARALLVSPVISAAQAQLGLQFVTTALATYDHNPGMHHTKAIFLFRQSALTEIESVSLACLDQALQSVETALLWDAEFPKFYSTRARIKYRLKDRPGALIDLRAAIELARYNVSSRVVQDEVLGWEALLDSWQLAPVGSFEV